MLQGGAEAVEPRLPQGAVVGEPVIQLFEGFGPERIESSLAVRPHLHEPGLEQDAQMSRNTRLMNIELVDHVVDLLLSDAERLDNATPGGVGKRLERII